MAFNKLSPSKDRSFFVHEYDWDSLSYTYKESQKIN